MYSPDTTVLGNSDMSKNLLSQSPTGSLSAPVRSPEKTSASGRILTSVSKCTLTYKGVQIIREDSIILYSCLLDQTSPKENPQRK